MKNDNFAPRQRILRPNIEIITQVKQQGPRNSVCVRALFCKWWSLSSFCPQKPSHMVISALEVSSTIRDIHWAQIKKKKNRER